MDQRDVLKKWMALEKIGRREAAEKLGIKQRRLATWLLPTSSNERRSIEPHVLEQVELRIKEAQQLAMLRGSGKIFPVNSIPSADCLTLREIEFPAIFRVSYPEYDSIDNGLTFSKTGNEIIQYQFTDNPAYYLNDGDLSKCERILHLDPTIDNGWLSVTHLRNSSEVDGFLLATQFQFIGTVSICERSGQFFALIHRTDRPANYGLIVYNAQYQTNHPTFGGITEIDTLSILPSGDKTKEIDLFSDGD